MPHRPVRFALLVTCLLGVLAAPAEAQSVSVAARVPEPIDVAGVHAPGAAAPTPDDGVAVDRHDRCRPAPLGLPCVPTPMGIADDDELARIGRNLFFDASLRQDGQRCSSCHDPSRGFGDGAGVPRLLNLAFRPEGADGPGLPSTAPHHVPDLRGIRAQLRYGAPLARATAATASNEPPAALALESYVRSLVSAAAPFDEFLYGHEPSAISASARSGFDLFVGKAGCSACHRIEDDHALLTDYLPHDTGIGFVAGGAAAASAPGWMDSHSAPEFPTPSLRDVASSPPYMHDGSLATLGDVIRYYDAGGNAHAGLDPRLRPLHLTATERLDLEAFLETLNGTIRFSPNGLRLNPPVSVAAGVSAAALGFRSTESDLERNAAELEASIARAAARGARLVLLPEHALGGAVAADGRAMAELERAVQRLRSAAWQHRLWLGVSELQLDDVGAFVGLRLFDDQGRLRLHTAKQHVHPARDGAARPRALDSRLTVDAPGGRWALISGDDLVELLPRLVRLGAETVLVASAGLRDHLALEALRELARSHRVQLMLSDLGSGGRDPWALAIARDGAVVALGADLALASVTPLRRSYEPVASAELGRVPLPTDRELDPECVRWGRELFFEPRLGVDRKTSCASCHRPDVAFSDGRPTTRGAWGRGSQLNTPSLLNVAYRSSVGRAGRVDSIELQTQNALLGWAELGNDAVSALDTAAAIGEHAGAPRNSVGAVTLEDALRCLADYQRTLTSGPSAFDRYFFHGDREAISRGAARGLELFVSHAGCAQCHAFDRDGARFTDDEAHNTGVGFQPRLRHLGYAGDGLPYPVGGSRHVRGRYATPSLRDVARTAPYMHDGSMASLEEVIDFYDRGGTPNQFLDPRLHPLQLDADEKRDLAEFLKTLTTDGAPP